MDTFLVGGAVRDALLGIPVKDRDWVVVGETPERMLKAGFKSVGKDFPVFLHPDTHEEYALARKERKVGPGYHGFDFDTSETVSLTDDLSRRDLTINAIAQTPDGDLIDPYNGQQDLKLKLLRHVSEAFSEDPVRVLRTARFQARFAHLGFHIADSTKSIMQRMVRHGEVDHLVSERVWKEVETALGTNTPSQFFISLQSVGALMVIMPELGSNATCNDSEEESSPFHLLDKMIAASDETTIRVRFALLASLIKDDEHFERFCLRLRVPKQFQALADLSRQYSGVATRANTLEATELLALLKSVDAIRRPERFKEFLLATTSLQQKNLQSAGYEQVTVLETTLSDLNKNIGLLEKSQTSLLTIDAGRIAAMVMEEHEDKSLIPDAIQQAQLSALENILDLSD